MLETKFSIINIPIQFYSANWRPARTKLCSSNALAYSINRSDWHFESNRSVRKLILSLKWHKSFNSYDCFKHQQFFFLFFSSDEQVSAGATAQSGRTVGLWIVHGNKRIRPHCEYRLHAAPLEKSSLERKRKRRRFQHVALFPICAFILQ